MIVTFWKETPKGHEFIVKMDVNIVQIEANEPPEGIVVVDEEGLNVLIEFLEDARKE